MISPTINEILVPIDGSDSSFRAAKYAIKIAKMTGAGVTCMHSVVNPPYGEYGNAGATIVPYLEEVRRYAET